MGQQRALCQDCSSDFVRRVAHAGFSSSSSVDVQRRIGVVFARRQQFVGLDADVLFDIQLFFELPFHDARHATRLAQPTAELAGNARQSLGPQHQEPDQQEQQKFRSADSGHGKSESGVVFLVGVFGRRVVEIRVFGRLADLARVSSSASLTAERKPLTALPRSEPSVRRRFVPKIARTMASTINNCTGPMLENISKLLGQLPRVEWQISGARPGRVRIMFMIPPPEQQNRTAVTAISACSLLDI